MSQDNAKGEFENEKAAAQPAYLYNDCGEEVVIQVVDDKGPDGVRRIVLPNKRTLNLAAGETVTLKDDFPVPVQVVQCNDMVGTLEITFRDKATGKLSTEKWDCTKPLTVPDGFRLLQISPMSGQIKLDSNNDSPGALVAQSIRRFNDNVLRMDNFKCTVSDEVASTDEQVKASTVWFALGELGNRHQFEMTIQRTNREPPERARQTPIVAGGKS